MITRSLLRRWSSPARLLLGALALLVTLTSAQTGQGQAGPLRSYLPLVMGSANFPPIVFVSRQIPRNGTIYWNVPHGMPGVGSYSRFQVASPGNLLIREPDGRIRTLIDGSKPDAASLSLIDVNAPDVSYDGKRIVFAGLPSGTYERTSQNNPGTWRIYTIDVDGGNLRQVTRSDQVLDMGQFGDSANALTPYDDTDPAWLPDGRIVFSSTRWPSFGMYSGVRTTNLHVVNADGSSLHRITSERNGADRPLVDPQTGKIVFSRWWRNGHFAVDSLATILKNPANPAEGYIQKDGVSADRNVQPGLWRNAWQPTAINPDGTGLAMWSGTFRDEEANHVYGGAFTPQGDLIANYFPMYNMTEAAGFGGLRRYKRGPFRYTPIIGVSGIRNDYVSPANPTSYGVYASDYAAEPDVLSDGQIIFSYAADIGQDYGIYLMAADGSARQKLYDVKGTTELRPRAVRARPLPPVIPDTVTKVASLLPPTASGPYAQDGTFVFDDLNIYANAPVDSDIVSAPPVGSAANIRFFMNQQRTGWLGDPNIDWPILLSQLQVSPAGAVRNDAAPANVPLFEQIRGADGSLPRTFGPDGADGAGHVAGLNYGHPGEHVRCVGCHAGHSMMAVPATAEAARWSNLAPGATVTVSSAGNPDTLRGLIDRQVMKGPIWHYWTSASGQSGGQWVQLTFPVPVIVRQVRLYNPRQGDDAKCSVQVGAATVRLFADAAATQELAKGSVGPLSVFGSDVSFADITVRAVRVQIDTVSGTFYGAQVASLAEIEVVAQGAP